MKRLYKSDRNVKICGVCAGIADYFGVDPTLIRVIFVIAVMFFGTGILPYIVLAVVMPHESRVMNYMDPHYFSEDDYR